jgi:hypothetical protein
MAKNMFISCHHNAGKNRNLMVGNKFLENVEEFKQLITTAVANQIAFEEIKSRINKGNSRYTHL